MYRICGVTFTRPSWARSSLRLRFDDFDSVVEFYTEDDFGQLVWPLRATSFARRRRLENQLSMTLVVRWCFLCSARQVVEGGQCPAFLDQVLELRVWV
jgi:hypothetical protein